MYSIFFFPLRLNKLQGSPILRIFQLTFSQKTLSVKKYMGEIPFPFKQSGILPQTLVEPREVDDHRSG